MDQAINAGLALSCYARLALHGLPERGVSLGTFLEIHRVLEKTVIDLCRGQYMDLAFRDRSPSLDEYLEMVRLKTGVLMGTACEVGALVARASGQRAEARGFGETLGIGFQLRDDYLGAWGNPQEMGKAADDLKDRKWSLPIVVGGRPVGTGDSVRTDVDRMIREWSRLAHVRLSEIDAPPDWVEIFLELTNGLAVRLA